MPGSEFHSEGLCAVQLQGGLARRAVEASGAAYLWFGTWRCRVTMSLVRGALPFCELLYRKMHSQDSALLDVHLFGGLLLRRAGRTRVCIHSGPLAEDNF